MTTDLPAWITVGAKVAVKSLPAGYSRAQFSFPLVERLTPTQIVLSNGVRARRSDLRLTGGTCGELLPFYDAQVTAARARIRVGKLGKELAATFGQFPLDGDVRSALALLDQTTARIAAVRGQIARLAEET